MGQSMKFLTEFLPKSSAPTVIPRLTQQPAQMLGSSLVTSTHQRKRLLFDVNQTSKVDKSTRRLRSRENVIIRQPRCQVSTPESLYFWENNELEGGILWEL